MGERKRRLTGAVMVAGIGLLAGATTPARASDGDTVRAFVAAFNARDVDAVMAFFADDAIYHNMPGEPLQGKEAIRRAIESFVAPASEIAWEILHLSERDGVVLTERVDRFVLGGKKIALPVMGAFELEDGKITAWRDYFDMATWQRQAGGG